MSDALGETKLKVDIHVLMDLYNQIKEIEGLKSTLRYIDDQVDEANGRFKCTIKTSEELSGLDQDVIGTKVQQIVQSIVLPKLPGFTCGTSDIVFVVQKNGSKISINNAEVGQQTSTTLSVGDRVRSLVGRLFFKQ